VDWRPQPIFYNEKTQKDSKILKGCCVEVRDRLAKLHACTFNPMGNFPPCRLRRREYGAPASRRHRLRGSLSSPQTKNPKEFSKMRKQLKARNFMGSGFDRENALFIP